MATASDAGVGMLANALGPEGPLAGLRGRPVVVAVRGAARAVARALAEAGGWE